MQVQKKIKVWQSKEIAKSLRFGYGKLVVLPWWIQIHICLDNIQAKVL